MTVVVDIQLALDESSTTVLPANEKIRQWANAAIKASGCEKKNDKQMAIRIVEEAEISQLNKDYRHKDGATNVLSFPFVLPPGVPEDETFSLGDLVVCASVVEKEAIEQGKTTLAHWSHMIVHGTLHLLGYDHQTEREALEMETLEASVLADIGYPNPYG